MGIRFEKDTILNWINEMGKFLRLLVDKWESFDESTESVEVHQGYKDFFNTERQTFLTFDSDELTDYIVQHFQIEQIRPLALLFMYDGLLSSDKSEQQNLLLKAKFLLEYVAKETGNFSFEDFGHLKTIGDHLE
ncbi:hypothetical protein [Sphingobacterium hungaricum]|uniref:Uncharacterized protein n=1 Tax=Sphingobacterium hungaricum TaxID=2082723 RepID=A0A928UZQ2_9SPHI|nr:hypothetical protein [Sphingobacterium hungaricum]MBE8713792.1 hypothetical protein [Sphingobacterium hungaricum]